MPDFVSHLVVKSYIVCVQILQRTINLQLTYWIKTATRKSTWSRKKTELQTILSPVLAFSLEELTSWLAAKCVWLCVHGLERNWESGQGRKYVVTGEWKPLVSRRNLEGGLWTARRKPKRLDFARTFIFVTSYKPKD